MQHALEFVDSRREDVHASRVVRHQLVLETRSRLVQRVRRLGRLVRVAPELLLLLLRGGLLLERGELGRVVLRLEHRLVVLGHDKPRLLEELDLTLERREQRALQRLAERSVERLLQLPRDHLGPRGARRERLAAALRAVVAQPRRRRRPDHVHLRRRQLLEALRREPQLQERLRQLRPGVHRHRHQRLDALLVRPKRLQALLEAFVPRLLLSAADAERLVLPHVPRRDRGAFREIHPHCLLTAGPSSSL
mmetsp:Transcript_19189/g.60349  ORF Transcript_19189/g.60349 Transcript_19189/m.60349 type:complete len:250 (-) Transcript_19189:12-761(-)